MSVSDTPEFFVTTSKGMEGVLEQELLEIGAPWVKQGRAGVSIPGTLELGYRVCLWSRIANRVLLPLTSFSAPNPDALYAGIRSIDWTEHLTENDTIAVDFATSHSKITHSHYAALKVKDAIVDLFRDKTGVRPSVDTQRPKVRVNVYLHEDLAKVSIDLSGDSLHRRGYREEGGGAPLKENLAAGILRLSQWPNSGGGWNFLDPMCGSGTLAIEAASMVGKIAPGLGRDYYGFLGWQGHIPRLWKRLCEEAQDVMIRDRKLFPSIRASDTDFRAVRIAEKNIERAGLLGKVRVEQKPLSRVERVGEKGLFVVNPPYGERLGEVETLKLLYKEMGDTLKKNFKGWEASIFTGNLELGKNVGLKPSRRHVLFHGPIECRLLQYSMY